MPFLIAHFQRDESWGKSGRAFSYGIVGGNQTIPYLCAPLFTPKLSTLLESGRKLPLLSPGLIQLHKGLYLEGLTSGIKKIVREQADKHDLALKK